MLANQPRRGNGWLRPESHAGAHGGLSTISISNILQKYHVLH